MEHPHTVKPHTCVMVLSLNGFLGGLADGPKKVFVFSSNFVIFDGFSAAAPAQRVASQNWLENRGSILTCKHLKK